MNSTLKTLRKMKNVSQRQVAEYLNCSASAYQQYEAGTRTMNPDTLLKLSDYYNVSTDTLLGRGTIEEVKEDPVQYAQVLEEKQEIMIPLISSIRRIGRESNTLKYIPVPASYVSKYGNDIICLMAAGDSMSPTFTQNNYLVCIPGKAWANNQIVVIDINDGETIKRIRSTSDGGYDLVSDNQNYKTIHLTPQQIADYQVRILGRIVRSISPEL